MARIDIFALETNEVLQPAFLLLPKQTHQVIRRGDFRMLLADFGFL